MIDLTEKAKSKSDRKALAFSTVVDKAMLEEQKRKSKERYKNRPKSLGAGSIGYPLAKFDRGCERALYYGYKQYEKDEGTGFTPDLYRVFDMGHDAEERIAQYIRTAGFDLKTENPKTGKQWGFTRFPDPETGVPRMRGFADGVFVNGPELIEFQEAEEFQMSYPFLWECKALKDKAWKNMVNNGIKKSHPKYYAQVQLYMGVFGLTEEPALLTAVNRGTGELHCVFIEYNQKDAQSIVDRAVRVISANSPTELPRIHNDYTRVPCTWCPYKSTCKMHEEQKPTANTQPPKFWR